MSAIPFLLILFFLIGSSLGSFLNVLIDRLPKGESILGRSRCDSCNKILNAFDLIPIVSYFLLFGRCRHCRSKIPTRLVAIEVISGLLTSSLFLYVISIGAQPFLFFFLLVIMLSFVGIFFSDLAYGIIPDEFVVAIIVFSFFLLIFSNPNALFSHFLSGFGFLLFFFILYAATRARAMGFGDVKLSLAMGFFLGFPQILVGFYLAFLTGAVFSLILIAMGLKKLRGGTIPFGPFLSIGAIISYFLGSRILDFFI